MQFTRFLAAIVLLSSMNISHASLMSSPLYSQKFNFSYTENSDGWYFFLNSLSLNCETCQNVNINPKYMTINYPVPQTTAKGSINLYYQLKQDYKLACEYTAELPFTIQPTGELTFDASSYDSWVTAEHSSHWCREIARPVTKVLRKGDDFVLEVSEVKVQ